MKTIIFSFFSVIFTSGLYAQQGVIAQPEIAFMYRGYQNKIVPMIPSNEEIILEVDGGSAVKATWTDQENQINGYYINPNAKLVTIRLSGKNNQGTIKDYGTFKYHVKAFPVAQLENTSISKTTGCALAVSLGADSPLTSISFSVSGGSITIENETFSFDGVRVPASLLKKAKVGSNIAIEVTYTRNGIEGSSKTVTSMIKVVD